MIYLKYFLGIFGIIVGLMIRRDIDIVLFFNDN